MSALFLKNVHGVRSISNGKVEVAHDGQGDHFSPILKDARSIWLLAEQLDIIWQKTCIVGGPVKKAFGHHTFGPDASGISIEMWLEWKDSGEVVG